jgi:hypothetical protein
MLVRSQKSNIRVDLTREPVMLRDKNGNEIPKSNYRQIFSNTDEKAKQLCLFRTTRKTENPISITSLIVMEKNITPEGFGLPENITSMYTGINGAILVVHMQDALQRKMPSRTGVINFKGEWIVEPDYQVIYFVGNELIQVKNYTKSKSLLLDRYGKPILKKDYHILDNDNRDYILHDRILVGYIDDFDQYVQRLGDAMNETDPDRIEAKMAEYKRTERQERLYRFPWKRSHRS